MVVFIVAGIAAYMTLRGIWARSASVLEQASVTLSTVGIYLDVFFISGVPEMHWFGSCP